VKPKLFIPQPIPEVAVERLRNSCDVTVHPHVDRRMPHEEILQAVADKDILFALGDIPYDRQVIAAAPRLRLIAAMHPSATFVDKQAATQRGIPVTLIPNRLAKTTAEFTFALLVATAWRIPEADRFVRDGRWHQNQSQAFLGMRLFDKTLGIVGLGAIGADLATKARGLGMAILYAKRTPLSPVEEQSLGVEFRTLRDLFREADVIALTLSLTNETQGMITKDLIDLMKPSAILINTSRGAVLDEDALEAALVEGRIRGAGLDVYRREVADAGLPGPSERFKRLENVVLTPHIGSAARETREEMALRTVENIELFLAGERPLDVANPEVFGEAGIESDIIG
jgi:glyoxylate reductase